MDLKGDINLDNKNKKNIEVWRILIFVVSALFIGIMWVKNDIVSIYTTMPPEHIISMIATTVMITLIKVVVIAGGVILVKRLLGKLINHSRD